MFKPAAECVPNILVNLVLCDKIQYKSCSFHGDRIPWNFLGQTAISGCDFLSYRELILPPASGCDGGLVVPKLMTRCPTVCCVCLHSASRGTECNTSGQWEESKGRCTWPGLSIPGCVEHFSQLITGSHVRPYMKLCTHFTETFSTTRNRQPMPSAMTFWLLHQLLVATYNLMWSYTCSLLKHCLQPGIDSLGQVHWPFDFSH